VITYCYGRYWHFSPKHDPVLNDRDRGLDSLHGLIARYLNLSCEKKVLELGCGYGRCAEWMARNTGAHVTGLTLSPNEVEYAQNTYRLSNLKILEGDYHEINSSHYGQYDCVYAVYCLKYSSKLPLVLENVYKCLKPGGYFLSYEILTTEKYNPQDPEQRKLVERISSSTNMPPLHNVKVFEQEAKKIGLEPCIVSELSSKGDEWYNIFQECGWYYVVKSPIVNFLVYAGEKLGLLNRGFHQFYEERIVHPLADFVDAGKLDIVTGSTIMLFRKPL